MLNTFLSLFLIDFRKKESYILFCSIMFELFKLHYRKSALSFFFTDFLYDLKLSGEISSLGEELLKRDS